MQVLIMMISLFFTLTSCEQEEMAVRDIDTLLHNNDNTPHDSEEKQVIVLAAPSVHNDYYYDVFPDIVDFQVDYANKISGNDEVIILVDKDTRAYYQNKVSDDILVEADMEDIWIRDYSPVIAGKHIKFDYLPDYTPVAISNAIDNSFEDWFHGEGLQFGNTSNLILDGGNIVGNGNGKVVVTDRFLYDNPWLTKAQAKQKLKQLLGASHVAIIKETPGDATGHSDGMLMWADENKILLHDQPASVKNKIINELKQSFPNVEIVILPDYYQDENWGGFSSACNIYVNSLVTNNFIYMPTFNNEHDEAMLDLIQSHTGKTVIPVAAEKVCFMGGSLRCLTWQVGGSLAKELLEL